MSLLDVTPQLLASAAADVQSIGAELGINGGAPGSKPIYVAIGTLTFDTVEAFEKSFGPHAGEIMADIPNYTNVQPVIQISEISL